MKQIILITFYFLLFTFFCFPQHPQADILAVDSLGVVSDSTDLGNFKLLGIKYPATFTSDTIFVQTKNLATDTWANVYYISSTGARIRAHILFQASAYMILPKEFADKLLRYVRFIPDDPEADDRIIIAYKGY